MERKEGFYWVKYNGKWTIAERITHKVFRWRVWFNWAVMGFDDSDFDAIGDEIVKPESHEEIKQG